MTAQLPVGFREALRAALGTDSVLEDSSDLQHYGTDRCRGGWPVHPGVVVLPRRVQQVQDIVRLCAEHGIAIVPSGGRTGLTGAATATSGELVLSLERMNRVLEVDSVSRLLRCEAGATVESVQQAAATARLFYPVDFASKGSAQIGGSIATNAGGVKVIRYGTTRQWVMGVRAVLASGEVLDAGGRLVKDNTGYDLARLFVGSEGTLGVIVEATLRLCTPPAAAVVALCAVADDLRILELFATLERSGLVLSAFECFDHGCLAHVYRHRSQAGPGPFDPPGARYVLVEIEVERSGQEAFELERDALAACLADAQEGDQIRDAVVASTNAQARELWGLREDISEALHRHTPHKADVALPVGRIAEFVSHWREAAAFHLPGFEALVFGHVGDGNLHLNLLRPPEMELEEFLRRCRAFDDVAYELVGRMEGSVSAEHGIGLLKRGHLRFSRSEVAIDAMKAIKQALDPKGIFNPGKIF